MGKEIKIERIENYIRTGNWSHTYYRSVINSAKLIKDTLIDLPDRSIASYNSYIAEQSKKASECFIKILTSSELSYADKEKEFKSLCRKVLGIGEYERFKEENHLRSELSDVRVSLEYGPITVKGKIDSLCKQGNSHVAVCLRVGSSPLGEKKFHQDACQSMLAFFCLAVREKSDLGLSGNKINRIFYCNPTCKEWYVKDFSEEELCRYNKIIARCVDDFQKQETKNSRETGESYSHGKTIDYGSKDYYNKQINFPDNFLI